MQERQDSLFLRLVAPEPAAQELCRGAHTFKYTFKLLFVKESFFFFEVLYDKNIEIHLKKCFCYPAIKGLMTSGFESNRSYLQPGEHWLSLVSPVCCTK